LPPNTPRDSNDEYIPAEESWRRELRQRQSRWRASMGYPMGLHRGRPLGSRLAMPEAEEQVWNFLTPRVGDLVRREVAENAQRPRAHKKLYGEPRIFCDLLSSQPLVFNLFGELAHDLDRATAFARRLWPDRIERVTRVEFEWSPGRQNPRYLNNGSAADAALFYTTPRGGKGIVFVETKYHEDLRGKDAVTKPRYAAVARRSGAFSAGADEALGRGSLQQIWLDHLLALATRDADRLENVLFVLMYPEANPRCAEAAARYRGLLDAAAPSTFEALTLERVVEALAAEVDEPWVDAFRDRYLTA
jgi:hypothetical protein